MLLNAETSHQLEVEVKKVTNEANTFNTDGKSRITAVSQITTDISEIDLQCGTCR
jgi:hypothetical protein